LAERTQRFFEAIGNCLAERFALVGLFGVDAVLADGAVWLIEVNPRYTASVEVLEQALDTKLLPLHVHACQHQEIPATSLQTPSHYVGKAVVYATQAVTIPDAFGELVARYPTGPPWPTLADVPPGGTAISPGQPVLTVIATGHRLVGVYHQLRNLVRQVQGGVGCEEAP
jgi:predicted ATP-grasp superfamily ATP-dependent carboligase